MLGGDTGPLPWHNLGRGNKSFQICINKASIFISQATGPDIDHLVPFNASKSTLAAPENLIIPTTAGNLSG